MLGENSNGKIEEGPKDAEQEDCFKETAVKSDYYFTHQTIHFLLLVNSHLCKLPSLTSEFRE